MSDSVINVVSAHKQLVIAIVAFAVVAGSFSYIPYAAAQSLSVDGVDIDLSDGVMVDVTNGRYIHIDVSDGNVVVDVDGVHIDTGSMDSFLP
jgi:hypothetical protein